MKSYCRKCGKILEMPAGRSGHVSCPTCGSAMNPVSATIEPGAILNGFLIESKIGQGGMGVVYKAKQINLDRYVALKVLSDDLASDAEFVERFFREARAAAGLSHPNIVQVYDAGTASSGIYYFAMELVEGETLEARILRDGVVSPRDALDIAHKIAQALEYAWDKQKLSHGDIKPENIMLNSSGGVKLADLGLAKTHHEDRGQAKDGIMATPLYAAPEIIAGELHRAGAKSDMYSFGATLYHMLAGSPPFNDTDIDVVLKKHLDERPKFLSEVIPELNPLVAKLVDNLLLKNPEDRPASWRDIVKSIENIHNVERKVFHKAPSHPAHREKASSDEKPAVHAVAKKKSSMIRNLSFLILFLVLILVSLAFLLLMKKDASKVSLSVSPAKIVAEWETLKNQIFYMPPEDALERIDRFLIKYDKAITAEMLASVEKNREDILAIKRDKDALGAKKKEFENELYLLKTLLASDFSKESIEKLVNFKLRIESVLETSAKKPSVFVINDSDRALLNDCYMRIASIIIAYEKEQDRLRREAEEKAEKERAEREAARIEQEKKKREELLTLNSAIDEYYLVVADFADSATQKKGAEAFSNQLSELIKNPALPDDYKRRAEFLATLKGTSDISQIFIKNAEVFIGRKLPLEGIDPQYKIAEISDKGIKIIKAMNDAVKMTKTVPWRQISVSAVQSLLRPLLDSEKLRDDEKKRVLFFFICGGGVASVPADTEKFLPSNESERNACRSALLDCSTAALEKELVLEWRRFLKIRADGDERAAALVLNEIYNSDDSQFRRRYLPELVLLLREFKKIDPQIEASWILLDFKEKMDRKKPFDALSSAVSAKNRVFGLNSLNPLLKEKIENGIAVALSEISKSVKIGQVKDIRIPFLDGQARLPGYPIFAYEFLKGNGGMKDNSKFLSTMLMAGYLSFGDWGSARRLQKTGKAFDIPDLLQKRKDIFPWTNSLLMSWGLLSIRYAEDTNNVRLVMEEMLRTALSDNERYGETASLCIALKYAIAARIYSRIFDAVAHYDFRGERNKELELKIAMMHLWAILNKGDSTLEEFDSQIAKYAALFSSVPNAASDMKYVQLVSYLNKGNMSLSEEHLKVLSEKCVNQDLCLKLLSSVVAKNMLSGRYPNPFVEVISSIRSAKSASAIDTGWTDNSLVFLSNSHSLAKILDRTDELLNQSNFGSTGIYAKLKMLKAVLAKNVHGADMRNARIFIDACESVSESEKKIFDAILTGGLDALQEKLASRGLVEDVYWSGIYSMILSAQDRKKIAEIEEALNINASLLTWQERLFMSKIKALTTGE